MSAVSGEKNQNAVVATRRQAAACRTQTPAQDAVGCTLAERFAAGDELAFDVLYERHRPVVLAVSMGVLGTTQDAEDATQETFSALAVALRTKPPAEMRPVADPGRAQRLDRHDPAPAPSAADTRRRDPRHPSAADRRRPG